MTNNYVKNDDKSIIMTKYKYGFSKYINKTVP